MFVEFDKNGKNTIFHQNRRDIKCMRHVIKIIILT